MHIKLRKNAFTTLQLSFTDVEARKILKAKKPVNVAMGVVRKRLGTGHGFYPELLELGQIVERKAN